MQRKQNASRVLSCLVLSLSLLASVNVAAQAWDPLEYLQLLDEADRAYARAQALPITYQEARQELLVETLRLKQQAMELLRRAVLSGEISEIDALYDDAVRDLFNLNENLLYLLMELNQCDAAEIALERTLADPFILPPGGQDQLEELRPLMEECRVRVREARHQWDYERLNDLLEESVALREEAEGYLAAGEVDSYRLALFESVQATSGALDILRAAMLSGSVDPSNPAATGQLFDLYHQLITGFLDMNQCEAAAGRLDRAIEDAGSFPDGHPEGFVNRRPEVDACGQRVADEQAALSRGVTVIYDGDNRPLPATAHVGVAPYVLWGLAGATGLTALGLDIATGSDRDELESLRAQCETGTCDFARSVELSESVNDRKVAIGVLAGASVVTAIVGTIMYFTADTQIERQPLPSIDEEGADDSVAITPIVGFDELGVQIEF